MLEIRKSINLSGVSKIDDVVVANMNASISANGGVSTSTNIVNTEIYEKNKDLVLEDIKEFVSTAYTTEK